MLKNLGKYMSIYVASVSLLVLSALTQIIMIILKATGVIALTWGMTLLPLIGVVLGIVGIIITIIFVSSSLNKSADPYRYTTLTPKSWRKSNGFE